MSANEEYLAPVIHHTQAPPSPSLTACCPECGSERIWMQEFTYFRQQVHFMAKLPETGRKPKWMRPYNEYEVDYGPCYEYVYESTEPCTDADGNEVDYVCRDCDNEHRLEDLLIVTHTGEIVQLPEDMRGTP
jgi:hypothetical protein